MDTLQMIAILVVVILILMFVYYLFNKQKALTTGIRDAQKYYVVDTSSMDLNNSSSVSEMAVSVWVYVSDWKYVDGSDRIILYMGPKSASNGSDVYNAYDSNNKLSAADSGNYTNGELLLASNILDMASSETQSTIVLWMDSNNPIMNLGISKDGDPLFKDPSTDNFISVRNFPLQKWVCITFSVYQNVIDLYLNGKLIKSVIDDNVDIDMSEDVLVSLGNPFYVDTLTDGEVTISNVTTGFKGYTSRLSYYNKSLSPKDAYNIYKNGPGTSYLGDILGDRGVNINFMDGEKVTNTISL